MSIIMDKEEFHKIIIKKIKFEPAIEYVLNNFESIGIINEIKIVETGCEKKKYKFPFLKKSKVFFLNAYPHSEEIDENNKKEYVPMFINYKCPYCRQDHMCSPRQYSIQQCYRDISKKNIIIIKKKGKEYTYTNDPYLRWLKNNSYKFS